jgi:hypothetical protein
MPDPEEVKDALARVTASDEFARAPRMSRFLQFVVEETLAGRGGDLKEYIVGIRVFDKADAYDPAVDPTVRAEASKLRARLARYYQTEGQRDAVRIEIPKGGYSARFDQWPNGQPTLDAPPPTVKTTPSDKDGSPETTQIKRWSRTPTRLGLSLAVVVLLMSILAVVWRDHAAFSNPPFAL